MSVVNLTGNSGCYLTSPDNAVWDFSGDVRMDFALTMADWTPAAAQFIINKDDVSTQRSFGLYQQTNGAPYFAFFPDGTGTSFQFAAAQAAVAFTDGELGYLRVDFEREYQAGDWRVTFYTSTDGVTYAQLGSQRTGTYPGAERGWGGTTAQVEVGARSNASLLIGSIEDITFNDGIPGTAAVSMDPDDADSNASTTFTDDVSGVVWTLNGDASISGIGRPAIAADAIYSPIYSAIRSVTDA